MIKYLSLPVACIAMLFCSCKKEDLNAAINNGTIFPNGSPKAEATTLKPNKMVNYGALIDAPSTIGSLNFQLNVADEVGISCLRSRTLVPGNGNVPILNQTYKILLNFNSDNK